MNIKMLVTDIDGTLLPAGMEVPRRNVEAVQRAARAGVTVTVATGRMYRAALPVARALGVDVPIITYNGAVIKSVLGKVYDENFLSPAVVREALAFCRARGWHVQLYADDVLYFAERNAYAAAYEADQALRGEAVGWDGLAARAEHVAKLLVISDDAAQTAERVAALRAALGERAQVMRSNPEYTEIAVPGVTKASALRKLAAMLAVPLDAVMAIGDSDNDLPMLQAAGHSVAMGNAQPAVKAVCELSVGDCEAGGFAEAVERYVL